MSSISLSGNIYYVSLIDYSSRKSLIYFMKSKDEVFKKFREFKALVENQVGKKIKVLRSNNKEEYTFKEIDTFCKEARIKKEMTILYNPQQNGVAETKNRSIIETTKSMIHILDLCMYL